MDERIEATKRMLEELARADDELRLRKAELEERDLSGMERAEAMTISWLERMVEASRKLSRERRAEG